MSNNSSGKSGGRKRAARSGFGGHRFIEYSLSSNDKEILRNEYSESDFGYDLVEDLVGQGYKYSLSYSDSMQCFVASLTDRREDSHFNNTSLSGRGSSAVNARIALLYRHFVVAQESWELLDKGGSKPLDEFD